LDVLKNVEIIGHSYSLGEEDMNILRLSAIFHDVGYINAYAGHEFESTEIASAYLSSRAINKTIIDQICNAILATKIPQSPQTLSAKILCDADLMHLTYQEYFEEDDKLRIEWANVGRVNMNENQFLKNSLKFFKSHHYHTVYGQSVLTPLKDKTKERIENKLLINSSVAKKSVFL